MIIGYRHTCAYGHTLVKWVFFGPKPPCPTCEHNAVWREHLTRLYRDAKRPAPRRAPVEPLVTENRRGKKPTGVSYVPDTVDDYILFNNINRASLAVDTSPTIVSGGGGDFGGGGATSSWGDSSTSSSSDSSSSSDTSYSSSD